DRRAVTRVGRIKAVVQTFRSAGEQSRPEGLHYGTKQAGGYVRRTQWVSAVVACVLLFSAAAASAQSGSSIAGVVKDTTGAVMPGVTVGARSPALIEKVRSAVTDAEGQYKIVNLVPGTYTVTFTLTGFNTIKREGIELTASFTANVNSELKVGSLEETITV